MVNFTKLYFKLAKVPGAARDVVKMHPIFKNMNLNCFMVLHNV
jgi:hypothetical protein